MILDAMLRFSNAQVVSADARSTNTIDIGKGANIFVGQPLSILIVVTGAADFTTGDETYSFQLRTDDNTSFSSPTTLSTNTVLASQLTLGSKVIIPCPVGLPAERYLELFYDVGGTTPTITVSAFLCPTSFIDQYTPFADNITIG